MSTDKKNIEPEQTEEKELCQEEVKAEEKADKTEKKADKKSEKAARKADKKAKDEKDGESGGEKAEESVEVTVSEAAMAALNDKYLRVCAEYDNFRKRSQKEKEAIYAEVKGDTLLKFLPVYDNLLRALNQPSSDEAYRKGVELIMNQFTATMEKLGVSRIESLGQKFDPAFHNAVMHVDDEEKGENEIVEVFQEGFILGDKVIRFAMVKVAN